MRAFDIAHRYSRWVFAAVASLSLTVHATNGYLMDGYGVKSFGIAGVGVALVRDAQAWPALAQFAAPNAETWVFLPALIVGSLIARAVSRD